MFEVDQKVRALQHDCGLELNVFDLDHGPEFLEWYPMSEARLRALNHSHSEVLNLYGTANWLGHLGATWETTLKVTVNFCCQSACVHMHVHDRR